MQQTCVLNFSHLGQKSQTGYVLGSPVCHFVTNIATAHKICTFPIKIRAKYHEVFFLACLFI